MKVIFKRNDYGEKIFEDSISVTLEEIEKLKTPYVWVETFHELREKYVRKTGYYITEGSFEIISDIHGIHVGD